MSMTDNIKKYISLSCDMDLVGIAPASVLANEPMGHRPEDLLPGAKSIIVFGRALADGAVQSMFRAFEDKVMSAQSSFAAYCEELAPNFLLVSDTFNICNYLEDQFGAIAMPLPFNVQQSMVFDRYPAPFFADPYGQGMPLHIAKAAYAAGLGEFGWSNRFLTPQYGPRQMLSAILTTLELDCDAPYAGGKLCDPTVCKVCSEICPTHAIPAYESGKSKALTVGEEHLTVADLNVNGCIVASLGYRKEFGGRVPVPDLITENDPDDETMEAAFHKKPINELSIEHYPRYFCQRCMIYCPVGSWNERFAETGFTSYGAK